MATFMQVLMKTRIFSPRIVTMRPPVRYSGSNSSQKETNNNVTESGEQFPPEEEVTFEQLMNNSRLLTSCGHSPVGHVVMGKIIAVVDKDLYIDFGGKFHGVVPLPKGSDVEVGGFRKGSLVEVKVKDLELTEHFLGYSRDTSLLEADIELVGLLRKGRMNVLKSNTFSLF